MITLLFNRISMIVIEQLLASGTWLGLTLAFYPIYKETVEVGIERANNRLRSAIYSQDHDDTGSPYAASVIDSFLNLLEKAKQMKHHTRIILTGIFGTVVLFFANLLRRNVILAIGPWSQQELIADLFTVALAVFVIQALLTLRFIWIVGYPYTFRSEQVEEFIRSL